MSDAAARSGQDPGDTAKPADETSWVESSRAIRWGLALALVLGTLALFCYWLSTGERLACQIVTVTDAAAKSTTTKTCGLPDVTDFAYVLAAVAVLLLPDAQKLKIGGFEFERLANRVEEQAHEINQLRNTVNTTVTIGADLADQLKAGFLESMETLALVREFLLKTPQHRTQLAGLDHLAEDIDNAAWRNLIWGIALMHDLIEEAGAASAALLATVVDADTAENEEQAEAADAVLSDYIGYIGPAGEGNP
jgi:hypothetical protein